MINRLNPKQIIILLFCLVLSACSNNNDLFFQFKGIDNSNWSKDKSLDFAFVVSDTTTNYDVFLEVRNNETYPFRNLWLFVQLKTPEGNFRNDTINCELADVFGKWHGKGSSLHTLAFPFEQDVCFRIPGTYVYSVRQGMREDKLEGISDIGLRIVKHSDQ